MNILFDKENSIVAFNTGSSPNVTTPPIMIFFFFRKGDTVHDFVIDRIADAVFSHDPRVVATNVTDKEGVVLVRKRIKKLSTNELLRLDIAKIEFCLEKILAYKDMTMKVST